MKPDEWQKQKREDEGLLPTIPFFSGSLELNELESFLTNVNHRIFGLYGVPLIGKSTLVREFLKEVKH